MSFLFSFIVINEVMNYPSDESCGEFVEIYNNSSDTIYLNGFKIIDGEDIDFITTLQNPPNYISSRTFILPYEYTLIIDPDYFSGNCSVNYNLQGNVLIVDDASVGNGIAKNDSIYILNQNNDTIAKFQKPILNIQMGYSVERINFDIDEWGISNVLNGTPNYQNSIFSNSLIKVDTIFIVSNILKIILKNLSNSTFSDNIKIISGDTLNFNITINPNSTYEIDLNLNTLKSIKLEILSQNFNKFFYIPITYPTLIINEIEYDAQVEWFEIYNNSEIEVDLSKFKIRDLAKNEFHLSGKIAPKGFKVFRADSFPDFITLNDNYESLILLSEFNLMFDSVYYTSSYGGKENYTLEKINPSLKGYLSDSWKSSLYEFGTPNKVNSVYISDSSLNLEIFISNKRVKRGEILTISAYLSQNDDIDVYLFDDIGRLINKVYSVRNTNRVIFNLNTSNLRGGIYIILFKGTKFNKKAYFRIVE
ncbi:MAG: lamin tail domain-containing protein [candidate division WOR-3 bacterium]